MRHTLIAAALLAAPAAVMAEGLSYTYADARYFSTDSDALSINSQGAALTGSFAIDSLFFVAGDASYAKSERFNGGKLDTVTAAVRGGAHYAVTTGLDAVASVGALFADISGSGSLNGRDDNDFGYVAQAGLRLALVPQVEVGGFYSYQSIFGGNNGAFTGDLQYHVTDKLSLVGSATSGDAADVYALGARYHF